jgi:hypothetical protein
MPAGSALAAIKGRGLLLQSPPATLSGTASALGGGFGAGLPESARPPLVGTTLSFGHGPPVAGPTVFASSVDDVGAAPFASPSRAKLSVSLVNVGGAGVGGPASSPTYSTPHPLFPHVVSLVTLPETDLSRRPVLRRPHDARERADARRLGRG